MALLLSSYDSFKSFTYSCLNSFSISTSCTENEIHCSRATNTCTQNVRNNKNNNKFCMFDSHYCCSKFEHRPNNICWRHIFIQLKKSLDLPVSASVEFAFAGFGLTLYPSITSSLFLFLVWSHSNITTNHCFNGMQSRSHTHTHLSTRNICKNEAYRL